MGISDRIGVLKFLVGNLSTVGERVRIGILSTMVVAPSLTGGTLCCLSSAVTGPREPPVEAWGVGKPRCAEVSGGWSENSLDSCS